MPEPETKPLGALIQAYVRARWGDGPDVPASVRWTPGLEPGLRDRIDVLGLDGERLLDVSE